MGEMDKRLLILGCGYSARYISQKLTSEGWEIFGTTRSKHKLKNLRSLKIEPIFWDDISLVNNVLTNGCSVLSSIPPNGSIDDGLSMITKLLLLNSAKIKLFGYLSSTGVYGDRKGGWVSEKSPADTITSQGKSRVNAEKNWFKLASKYSIPLFVFRLSGIYGPDRNIFDRIKSGNVKKVVKQNQYFNRIHIDDLATAVCICLNKPELAGVYNIADDLPTPAATVIDEATKILGVPNFPEVNFSDANLSTMAKSFYAESKRVSNTKLTKALGYSLKYPTYVSGLRSLVIR